MVSEEFTPPDFAMLRAVEVLAKLAQRQQREDDAPGPPLDKPVVLFNETIALAVGHTTRAQVEGALGIAFAYPSGGWHTYCVLGPESTREFLTLFYSSGTLAAAELYLPTSDRAPKLAPRNLGRFRFVPAEITLGMQIANLPQPYRRVASLSQRGAYAEILEARFPGGAAYAMGNAGIIERLALYVLQDKPKNV